MKGAKPVWLVEVTGNPPQHTGTACAGLLGTLELRGHHTWCHQVAAAKWHPRQPHSPTLGLPLFLEAASFGISALSCAGRAGRCVTQSRIRLSSEAEGWVGGGGVGKEGHRLFQGHRMCDCLLPAPRPPPAGSFPWCPAGCASLHLPGRDSGHAGRAVRFMDTLWAHRPPPGPSFALWEGLRPRSPGDCSRISH